MHVQKIVHIIMKTVGISPDHPPHLAPLPPPPLQGGTPKGPGVERAEGVMRYWRGGETQGNSGTLLYM